MKYSDMSNYFGKDNFIKIVEDNARERQSKTPSIQRIERNDVNLSVLFKHCNEGLISLSILKRFFYSEVDDRSLLLWSWIHSNAIDFKAFKFLLRNIQIQNDLSWVKMLLSKNMHGQYFIDMEKQQVQNYL